MGMILGKICVETPNYQLVKTTADYEIRKYPSSVIAEITYDPAHFNNDKDGGFQVLAEYIGAFGNPKNTSPEKIAMTAPVITAYSSEKISMTAPVVTSSDQKMVTMGFILPRTYKKVEDVPKPVDERVVLREEGEKKYGVVRFSGGAGEAVVAKKVEGLRVALERDGIKVVGEFLLARYNPPWTLPPFRTNEVMLLVV